MNSSSMANPPAPFSPVAVAVKVTIAPVSIEAPTDCDPRDEPRVHSVAAVPFESEVACVGITEPSPDAGSNVIVDPATGFPCVSVTRTPRGVSSSVPTTPDCSSPETFTSSAGGPVSRPWRSGPPEQVPALRRLPHGCPVWSPGSSPRP